MSLEYLTMNVEYDLKKDEYLVTGNVNEQGQAEIIETFIRGQFGAGKDTREPNRQDMYHITLQWYPENDHIEVSSDTGNKGLRDGILMGLLRKLDE